MGKLCAVSESGECSKYSALSKLRSAAQVGAECTVTGFSPALPLAILKSGKVFIRNSRSLCSVGSRDGGGREDDGEERGDEEGFSQQRATYDGQQLERERGRKKEREQS